MTGRGSAPVADRARIYYAERRRREKHLPGKLFGEPAWDILLDLFISAGEGKPVFVSSACLAANVPQTTALRRIQILEEHGLVEREGDSGDNRRTIVRLTPRGHAAMAGFFDGSVVMLG